MAACDAGTGGAVYLRVDGAAHAVSGRAMRAMKMKINMNIIVMMTDITKVTIVMDGYESR